ncbi:MAG: hypothetical protein A4S12_02095 [Proteobacteria bacterium SG_bin5]|nr:hypothetical protein [Sphingomonas sp.]OQW39671.1 MAG: hypothetical protein A4S12_02095 [Proteobacteria bacterium SG_bin5]
MSDEATEGAKPDERDTGVLLYDFAKYLSSLALVILGGVVTLTSGAAVKPPARTLALVIGLIAVGGAFAMSTAYSVVRARLGGRALPARPRFNIFLAQALIALGTGAFLASWFRALQ